MVLTEFTAMSYSRCEIASFCNKIFWRASLSSASFLLKPNLRKRACKSSSLMRKRTVPFCTTSPSLIFNRMIRPAISERTSTSSLAKILPVEFNMSSRRVDLTTETTTAVFPPPFPPGPPFSFLASSSGFFEIACLIFG